MLILACLFTSHKSIHTSPKVAQFCQKGPPEISDGPPVVLIARERDDDDRERNTTINLPHSLQSFLSHHGPPPRLLPICALPDNNPSSAAIQSLSCDTHLPFHQCLIPFQKQNEIGEGEKYSQTESYKNAPNMKNNFKQVSSNIRTKYPGPEPSPQVSCSAPNQTVRRERNRNNREPAPEKRVCWDFEWE